MNHILTLRTERHIYYPERIILMTKIFKNWINRSRIHLIVWSIFIVWESVVIGLSSGIFGHPLTYAAHYMLIISVFYTHALFALPWSAENIRHLFWRLPFITLLEISVFILCSYGVDYILILAGFLKTTQALTLTIPYTMRMLYRGLYFIGFATGYYYLFTYLNEKKKTNELRQLNYEGIIQQKMAEEALIKAQNAFLMAQINPHFFFNTLDFLYHNILDVSPQSAEAINSLASMMRFAIDADKIGEYIILGDEIEQVENLIYLNQLRKPLWVRLRVDENVKELCFIPLVILTLVENIFKHGDLTTPEHEAEINIFINEDNLFIRTCNLPIERSTSGRSHTGLKNTAQRLQNVYGVNVDFTYGMSETGYFNVQLIIPLEKMQHSFLFSYPLINTDKV